MMLLFCSRLPNDSMVSFINRKSCSRNFCKIQRKASLLEFLFNKVTSKFCEFFRTIFIMEKHDTAWKMSEWGNFSSPCFSVFGKKTVIYGPEKPPYSDNFHAMRIIDQKAINFFWEESGLSNITFQIMH